MVAILPILAGVGGALVGAKVAGEGGSATAPASSNALLEIGTSKKATQISTSKQISTQTTETFAPVTTKTEEFTFSPQFILNSPNATQTSKKESSVSAEPQFSVAPQIIPVVTSPVGSVEGGSGGFDITRLLPVALLGVGGYLLVKGVK